MELKIRELRKKSHMSQADLAKAIGASLRTVGSWERGESLPNIEQIWNCAVALGSTPNDLMGWYIDHPQEATQPMDPEHAELVGYYDQCTDDRKDSLMCQARDAAFMSRGFPERDLDEATTA